MKKQRYILPLMALCLTACTNDENLGNGDGSDVIGFAPMSNTISRATIMGADAAEKLSKTFVVEGTFSTTDAPGTAHGFDNYNVEWRDNSATATTSNTSNWEYVGLTPNSNSSASKISGYTQEIKYWNHAADHYDFVAYSLGTLSSTKATASAINMANAKTATGAYTLTINDATALSNVYYSDMKTVRATPLATTDGKYDQPVTLTFHNAGAKVRVAIYENVPGYDVKDVKIYPDGTSTSSANDVILYNANDDGSAPAATTLANSGKVAVYFPTIGKDNVTDEDYNKAHLIFNTTSGLTTSINFGTLTGQLTTGDGTANTEASFIGRSMSTPTFAKADAADDHYYIGAFPTSDDASPLPLRLRVDYTLKSFDTNEEIKVTNQLTTVPATYCRWQPGYAYTYLFKITDQKLTPIVFDAIETVTEQDVVSTLSVPTITTYAKGNTFTSNTGSYKEGENVYVTVTASSGVVTLSSSNTKLYTATTTVSGTTITEDYAKKAMENSGTYSITTANKLTLTEASGMLTAVSEIPAADSYTGKAITINGMVFTPSAGTYVIEYINGANKYYKVVTVK